MKGTKRTDTEELKGNERRPKANLRTTNRRKEKSGTIYDVFIVVIGQPIENAIPDILPGE